MYYLDSAATTRPHSKVVDLVHRILSEDFGNPSSVHPVGIRAHKHVEDARKKIAGLFRVPLEAIIFCGSGSESNNLAIKGVLQSTRVKYPNFITSPLEHPSVSKTFPVLQKMGVTVRICNINPKTGKIDLNHLGELVDENTVLVSVQHVNNETGIIQDIQSIGQAIKNRNSKTLFHVDGTQSFTKLPIHLKEEKIDLFTLSAHKFHGIKGCGALVLGKRIELIPQVDGGGQEFGLRSGTENVAGIAALSEAATIACREMEENKQRVQEFSAWFSDNLKKEINGIEFLEFPDKIPHILSLSIAGIPGEVLLNHLAEEQIYVSTGSACHGSSKQLSATLVALEVPKEKIVETIRISIAAMEIPVDPEKLLAHFLKAVTKVRSAL